MDYDTLRRWADQEDLMPHAVAFALVDIAESLNRIKELLEGET